MARETDVHIAAVRLHKPYSPKYLEEEFCELRLLRGMRRTEVAGIILIGAKGLTR
jgi:hypothetical protein